MKPKLVVFDMDGTLTQSKMPVSPGMAAFVAHLTEHTKVAVVSGADFPQIRRQFLSAVPRSARKENLFFLPVVGGELWEFRKASWRRIYAELLRTAERKLVRKAILEALKETRFSSRRIYGRQVDDRKSQITFSALGSSAPISVKKRWDPEGKKRKKLAKVLIGKLPGFSIQIGGLTSIDITREGVGKPEGIMRLASRLHIRKSEILFLGDALFPGGNDYPVLRAGIRSVRVSGPRDIPKALGKIFRAG